MSLLKWFRDQFLFVLHCISLLILLVLNYTNGFLLTSTNGDTSDRKVEMNRFSVAFGVTDEFFVLLIFVQIFNLHRRVKLLAFEYRRDIFPFSCVAIYHFAILAPIHLDLLSGPNKMIHLFASCYDIQQFIASMVIVDYSRKLGLIQKALRGALMDGPQSTLAIQIHRKYSNLFKEYNQRHGQLNLLILMHIMVVITIQANVILMYVFNAAYRRPETWPRLYYMWLCFLAGLIKMGIICVSSNSMQLAWKDFEQKMAVNGTGYSFRGVMLQRSFSAAKCAVLNNQFFFAVRLIGFDLELLLK